MTYSPPVPFLWVAGSDATSPRMLTLTDAASWNLGSATSTGTQRPFARLRQASVQTIADSTWTAITFDAEDVDYGAAHSTSSNTDRYTAQVAGWYHVDATAAFVSNTTGLRGVRFAVNGTYVNGTETRLTAVAGGPTCVTHSDLVQLNAGDILRIEARQESGAGLNTNTTSQCSASIEWRSN